MGPFLSLTARPDTEEVVFVTKIPEPALWKVELGRENSPPVPLNLPAACTLDSKVTTAFDPAGRFFLLREGIRLHLAEWVEDKPRFTQAHPFLTSTSYHYFGFTLLPEHEAVLAGTSDQAETASLQVLTLPRLTPVDQFPSPFREIDAAVSHRKDGTLLIVDPSGSAVFTSGSGIPLGPRLALGFQSFRSRAAAPDPDHEVVCLPSLGDSVYFLHFGREAWLDLARRRVSGETGDAVSAWETGTNLATDSTDSRLSPADPASSDDVTIPSPEAAFPLPDGWELLDDASVSLLERLAEPILQREQSRGSVIAIASPSAESGVFLMNRSFLGVGVSDGVRGKAVFEASSRMVGALAARSAQEDETGLIRDLQIEESEWSPTLRMIRTLATFSLGKNRREARLYVRPAKDGVLLFGAIGASGSFDEIEKALAELELSPGSELGEDFFTAAPLWHKETVEMIARESSANREFIELEKEGKENLTGDPTALRRIDERILNLARPFGAAGARNPQWVYRETISLGRLAACPEIPEPDRIRMLREHLHALDGLPPDFPDQKTQIVRFRTNAHTELSSLLEATGMNEEAIGELDQAIAISRKVEATLKSESSTRRVVSLLQRKGNHLLRMKRNSDALTTFREALAVLDSLPSSMRTHAWLFHRCEVLDQVAGVEGSLGRTEIEKELLREVIHDLNRLEAGSSDRNRSLKTAEFHIRLAALLDQTRTEELDEAIQLRRDAVADFGEVEALSPFTAQETSTFLSTIYGLVGSELKRAQLLWKSGRLDEASDEFESALSHAGMRLAREPGIRSLDLVMRCRRERRNFQEANSNQDRAIAEQSALLTLLATRKTIEPPPAIGDRGREIRKMATMLATSGDERGALETLSEFLQEIQTRFSGDLTDNPDWLAEARQVKLTGDKLFRSSPNSEIRSGWEQISANPFFEDLGK